MENQQVSAQENAVQQHEGQVEGFGQHPLDSGGMGDANGGAPPMTPPPLDLGGPEAIAPATRMMSPNFSISESGEVHSGVSSPVAIQQPSTDPYQGESGMLQSGQNQNAMAASEPAATTSSQFDTFKATVNTNYGVLLTIETLDAYIENLRAAVQAANNPVYEIPFLGFPPGFSQDVITDFGSGIEFERGPVDAVVTDGELPDWYPDRSNPLPPEPIDLTPMEAEINTFRGFFEYLTANITDLNATGISSTWEDTLLLWMGGCESFATESRNALIRLDQWVTDNFLFPTLGPLDPWGPILWEPTGGLTAFPLDGNFLSPIDFVGPLRPGFPGVNTEAIRTSLTAFDPLMTQMTRISNDSTDDQIQALIDRDTPENRTKRIAFRDHVNTTHGLEFDVIDLIFDHLIENGVDPADHNAYNFVIGNGGDVQGTAGMDIIIAGPGTSSVDALGGDDFIYSSGEGAVVFSGAGDDTVHVAGENTVVDGGTGSDAVNTNGGGTTVIDREDEDQVSGLAEGESALGSNEDQQGQADRESLFGQTKWSLMDEFGKAEPYDYIEGQLEGFVETLNYELSLQVEAANAMMMAQAVPHFQQAIENAIALQMSQMSSMLLLGSQVPLAVGGASDFFRLAAARTVNIADRLTLRMHQAVGVAATEVAAQSLQQEEAPAIDERLTQLQEYITEFNTQYQGLMNQMTLLQLVPHNSNWEAGLLAEINEAITKVSSLQSQFNLIKGVPAGFGLNTLSTGETIQNTYELLYRSIEDVVVSSLGSSLGTEQSKLQGLLAKDSASQRSWRVEFRDRILGSHGLDFDTTDIIFDFLIANDLTPLGGGYTIRVANGGVIQGDEGIDILVGSDGNDVMNGGGGNDLILGMGGDDYIRGEEGHDTIFGGDGNDRIEGGAENDTLSGGSGDDLIIGDGGTDTFDGGEGEDLLHHEAGETHDGENGEAILDGPDHQAASGAGLAVVDITQDTFVPGSLADAQRIDAADANGIWVPVSLGELFEEATIPVYSTVNGYQTPEGANAFIKAINHPLNQITGNTLDYGVAVTMVNNAITIAPEIRIAGTEITLEEGNLGTTLQQVGFDTGGVSLGFGDTGLDQVTLVSSYSEGNLDFSFTNIPLSLGQFVQGTGTIGSVGGEVIMDVSLAINLGEGMSGNLELEYVDGQLSGSTAIDVNYGDISGSLGIYYNYSGITGLAGEGSATLNTHKLNGEVDLYFGPSSWVNGLVQERVGILGLNSSSTEAPSGDIEDPDITTIPAEETLGDFSWAGIVSGTVPIGENFDASAKGILDSEGDYALSLALNQTGDLELNDGGGGEWKLEENYPVADFGLPLIADISANLGAILRFGYNFSPIRLTNATLSGTYAKEGNKYGITNNINLGGGLSMSDTVTLGGGLELGIQEHVLTQSGRIQLSVEVDATIHGDSTAEANFRADFDDDGFHPHFNTALDISQDLDVNLTGKLLAENKIKHFFRHDAVQKIEVILSGDPFHLGHMDLEMGYNSDAENNKFRFGPPEGKDQIFQIASVEDMIENIHSFHTTTEASAGFVEPEELGTKVDNLAGEIDDKIDAFVDSSDESEFQAPVYSQQDGGLQHTFEVLTGLLDLYEQYSNYKEEDLTDEILRGLISSIKSKHKVFDRFELVDSNDVSGEATYGPGNSFNYLFWQWTASPTMVAPAHKKIKVTPGSGIANGSSVDEHKLDGHSDAAGKLPTPIEHTDVTFRSDTLSTTGEKVGIFMEAEVLGPDHGLGGSPYQNATKQHIDTDMFNKFGKPKMFRGHLLNDNLGGPGNPENLFPITPMANSNHKTKIEEQVKQWVNVELKYVYYKVEVTNRDDANGKADFVCEAYPIDQNKNQAGQGKKVTIHSDPSGATNATSQESNTNSGTPGSGWVEGNLQTGDIEAPLKKLPKGYTPIDDDVFDRMVEDQYKYATANSVDSVLNEILDDMVSVGSAKKKEKTIEKFNDYLTEAARGGQNADSKAQAVFNKTSWNRQIRKLNDDYLSASDDY